MSTQKEVLSRIRTLLTQRGVTLNQAQTKIVVDTCFDVAKAEVSVNNAFSHPKFGKFSLKTIPEHTRDMSALSNETRKLGIVTVPEKKKVSFKPSSVFIDFLNKQDGFATKE